MLEKRRPAGSHKGNAEKGQFVVLWWQKEGEGLLCTFLLTLRSDYKPNN